MRRKETAARLRLLANRRSDEVVQQKCAVCCTKFERTIGKVRYRLKMGHRPVCSRTCYKKLCAELRTLWWKNPKNKKHLKHAKTFSRKSSHKRVGSNNPNWKGGKSKQTAGYIVVRVANHPHAFSRSPGGYGSVFEHRLVMERVLGRYLSPDEDVHHRNGKKDDNRPENLVVVSSYAHWEEVGCPWCGKKRGVR